MDPGSDSLDLLPLPLVNNTKGLARCQWQATTTLVAFKVGDIMYFGFLCEYI